MLYPGSSCPSNVKKGGGHWSFGFAAIGLTALACGNATVGEEEPQEQARQEQEGELVDHQVQTGADGAFLIETLVGDYARLTVIAAHETTPAGESESTYITYGLATIEIQDGQLVMDEAHCHSDARSSLPVTVSMQDAVIQSLKLPRATLELRQEGDIVTVHRPQTPLAIGIRLKDANEPLPEDPSDARIWDEDGDGHPGITTYVDVDLGGSTLSAEVYVIRREVFEYNLTRMGNGRLEGVIVDSSEQLVVGASNPVFAATPEVDQDPDLSLSPVVLAPLADAYDCRRLMLEKEVLLPLPERP